MWVRSNPMSSKLFVARELAPARLRSSRKSVHRVLSEKNMVIGFGAASRPSGSKLPRHRCLFSQGFVCQALVLVTNPSARNIPRIPRTA
ncbi:hypothetical protein FFH90_007585 [Pseudomonas sp. ATCC 43928]|nr:hypothetical protein FFH90_007585 [Pseudomonas sp. ATCC 43928]